MSKKNLITTNTNFTKKNIGIIYGSVILVVMYFCISLELAHRTVIAMVAATSSIATLGKYYCKLSSEKRNLCLLKICHIFWNTKTHILYFFCHFKRLKKLHEVFYSKNIGNFAAHYLITLYLSNFFSNSMFLIPISSYIE